MSLSGAEKPSLGSGLSSVSIAEMSCCDGDPASDECDMWVRSRRCYEPGSIGVRCLIEFHCEAEACEEALGFELELAAACNEAGTDVVVPPDTDCPVSCEVDCVESVVTADVTCLDCCALWTVTVGYIRDSGLEVHN